MEKVLTASIRYLKGIGPKRAESLSRIGVNTIDDLLYYPPRRYEDRTSFTPIAKVQEEKFQTIKGRVLARGGRRSFRRKGFSITQIVVEDATGKISCVWFNQPYLMDYFKVGEILILYGKVERYSGQLQMVSPEFEVDREEEDISSQERDGASLNIGRIVPVYSLPDGMGQRAFRRIIKQMLEEYLPRINDFLPYDIRARNNLLNLAKGLLNIHFPESFDLQREAYRRLSFEEFFLFQIPLALRKLKKRERPGVSHVVEGALVDRFLGSLPFKLTHAQEEVIAEIKHDMGSPFAMQRLLQGDVGSGKTVVATIASVMAIQGGYQVAFMVPTEILASQHFEKINSQVSMLRSHARRIRMGLLVSSLSEKDKKRTHQEIAEGKIDLVIGTHALLEEQVCFKRLGLAVIDEQHKFGVGQRALLPAKGANPDILIMTATPIPRTLAITLYGDLDISVIRELPPGRLPVTTVHFSIEDRHRAYALAKAQLEQGHQAYIVYPVIEDSYALDMAGAKRRYAQLKSQEFKDFNVGLIHGQLRQKEQEECMVKFKQRALDVLVATTVLEVGIDIPNATCMIIENAERFGLSQLHQLRGRIGRGEAGSFCFLVSSQASREAEARLKAMVKFSDGFRIAEEDLKIRGPGEFFGSRQHGLSELKVANPLTQMHLLKLAREEAIRVIGADPCLESRQNAGLKEKLFQRFPEYEKLVVVA